MNNKTIECAYDNGTTVSVVDTATVFATGTQSYTLCNAEGV